VTTCVVGDTPSDRGEGKESQHRRNTTNDAADLIALLGHQWLTLLETRGTDVTPRGSDYRKLAGAIAQALTVGYTLDGLADVLNSPNEDPGTSDAKSPYGLLSHRIRCLASDAEATRADNRAAQRQQTAADRNEAQQVWLREQFYADYEPEAMAVTPALPKAPPDPNTDTNYRGLLAAGEDAAAAAYLATHYPQTLVGA